MDHWINQLEQWKWSGSPVNRHAVIDGVTTDNLRHLPFRNFSALLSPVLFNSCLINEWSMPCLIQKKKAMNLRKKLAEERGQGLIEYTLIVFLVALVLWLGVKSTQRRQRANGSLEHNYRLCRQPFFL